MSSQSMQLVSRRGLRTAVLLFSVILSVLPGVSAEQNSRTRQSLSGGWLVRQLDTERPDISALTREASNPDETWLSATMPAQVHDVLLQHGLIPDPRLSTNAAKTNWVADKDWAYACKFRSPSNAEGPVFLEFQGLDTLATAYLNENEIGRFDNMYRRYRVDIRKQLAPAGSDNLLLIVFRSPTRFLEELRQPEAHIDKIPRKRYLRKAPPDFNSYLGARPDFMKIGIYRDVILDVPKSGWIDDVWIRTNLSSDFSRATLRVHVDVGGTAPAVEYRLMDPSGREQAQGSVSSGMEIEIPVQDPKLWWPRTYGPAHLYKLAVNLRDGDSILDSRETRVGIREVKPVLRDPETGEKRFRFDVNGKPVYFSGGCWAPIDHMSHCWQPARARRLLDLAEHGRMNIFRIWAEGTEPPQEFYEECDRRGIMIWQDFFFANGMEPFDVPEFAENCRVEMEEMVRRLRNHPSLLLWVGGNENYMSVNFSRQEFTIGNDLFLEVMPDIVSRLDPGRFFYPSSPYGGRAPNWPLEGDWHDYTTVQFAPEASVPLWSSEVLRASPPSLNSMRQFLTEEELWPRGWGTAIRQPGKPGWPPAWEYHSTGTASWDRIGAIEKYIDPVTPAEFIRNLGTAHGEYLQDRVERQRRGVPDGAPDGSRRNWGNTVWRFNDPWPMIYSSVIDYYVEPKIAYYYLRRSYDPVLVSFERTPDWIAVWVTNDSPERVSGRLRVRHMKFDGELMGELSEEVSLVPAESKRVMKVTELGILSLRNEFLHATFEGHEATLLLKEERYLHLPKPNLRVRKTADGLTITTDVYARQVAFEVEGVVGAAFEDNYFDMIPGQTREVRILNSAGGRQVIIRAVNAEPVRVALE